LEFRRVLFRSVSALVMGVFDLDKNQGIGKIASKTLFYTIIASTFSVIIGIGLVNFLQPGKGFNVDRSLFISAKNQLDNISSNAQMSKPVAQSLVEIIPKNPLEAA